MPKQTQTNVQDLVSKSSQKVTMWIFKSSIVCFGWRKKKLINKKALEKLKTRVLLKGINITNNKIP